MKILYIIESLESGGKERRLVSLIKELEKRDGAKIEVLLLSKKIHYKDIFNLNINIHYLKRNIKKDFGILFKFNKLLKSIQPDIVHCWDNIAAFHFGPICKIKGIPFINSMITTAPPKLSKFSKRYFFNAISYPFSDYILTNSFAGLESYSVPRNKSKVIYNGIDIKRTNIKKDKKSVRDELGIGNKKVIGMTASFTNKKDHKTFVEAGALILNQNKNIVFITIGDGPNLENVKDSIDCKHKNHFKFLGKLTDVESVVNIFDIGVLSTFTEGISNAIMEYMMLEKPVVATGSGGTKELIVNNQTGYLIEQQKPKLLAEKLIFLLNNPQIAMDFGKKGFERINTVFSMEKMINETFQLYKEVIKNKKY